MDKLQKALGERICIARKRLGMTQKQLADLSGFPAHQIIHQIEKGTRDVKAWELAVLSKALRVDISELLADSELQPVPLVLWRKSPEVDKETKEADFIKRCQQYAFLEKMAGEVIESELPKAKKQGTDFDYRDAEKLADQIRNECGLGSRPAACLETTLENRYGVKIWYADLGEDGSAASTYGSFGHAILMNSIEAPWRRNFSFAHELFHLLTWTLISTQELLEKPEYKGKIESIANAFASNLLLPADSLRSSVQRYINDNKMEKINIVGVAREFNVSTEALLYRMLNLRVVDKKTVDELLGDSAFRALDRSTMQSGWGNPPPIPERFVRLAFTAFQKGNLSRTRLAEYLNTSLVDLTDKLLEYGLDDREDYKAEVRTSRRQYSN